MSIRSQILNKIKLLKRLAKSQSNENEAQNARDMIEKFISKHNITKEELLSIKEKDNSLVADDEKLFSSTSIIAWKQQLAFVVGTHFSCRIIQKEFTFTDKKEFYYFALGDEENVSKTKFVYADLQNKVHSLIEKNCVGQNENYILSYGEGAVHSIKANIDLDKINIPASETASQEESFKPEENKEEDKSSSTIKKDTAIRIKLNSDPVVEKKIDVNFQGTRRDVLAYFRGMADGKLIFLRDLLEETHG
jgi:hypothetical protein